MGKINGVVVGIAKDLNDPQKLGRIQVHFPWLSENNKSYWARIATLMAGPGRGSWFMPEKDDEVLVAFEHGDVQHPYIVGFLWNGVDKPPNKDIDSKVRRLKTVSGHVVDFDDRTGKEKVLIKTSGGHQIELIDKPGSISIKTNGEHQIEMKDAPGSIHVNTQGGQKVDLDDTPPKITIQTKSGNKIEILDVPPGIINISTNGMLNVDCLQANVTAKSLLNVTAPMVVFSGVVQTPTLIAQAVVGSAYTPAPGNTFGL